MTDKAYAVPLHEQLASVPRDSRLIIDDADGKGTRFIPVGRMCHEAAEALRARLAQPEPEGKYSDIISDGGLDPRNKFDTATPQREWQGLTDEELREVVGMPSSYSDWNPVVVYKWLHAIEAKLKEKNHG